MPCLHTEAEGDLAHTERRANPGYSTCKCCQRPWATVKGHVTKVDAHSGCFPLCEGCWANLTVEERLPHYRELLESWEPMEPGVFERRWPATEAAVRAGR